MSNELKYKVVIRDRYKHGSPIVQIIPGCTKQSAQIALDSMKIRLLDPVVTFYDTWNDVNASIQSHRAMNWKGSHPQDEADQEVQDRFDNERCHQCKCFSRDQDTGSCYRCAILFNKSNS